MSLIQLTLEIQILRYFNIFLLEKGLTDQKYSYLFKLVLPPSESYMSTSNLPFMFYCNKMKHYFKEFEG